MGQGDRCNVPFCLKPVSKVYKMACRYAAKVLHYQSLSET